MFSVKNVQKIDNALTHTNQCGKFLQHFVFNSWNPVSEDSLWTCDLFTKWQCDWLVNLKFTFLLKSLFLSAILFKEYCTFGKWKLKFKVVWMFDSIYKFTMSLWEVTALCIMRKRRKYTKSCAGMNSHCYYLDFEFRLHSLATLSCLISMNSPGKVCEKGAPMSIYPPN